MSIDYKNIEFQLHEYLIQMKNGSSFLDVEDSMISDLDDSIQVIKSRKCNVAVVGEFRRGKSSLINGLLGFKVLPADVTPTTATINRITYGTEPQVTIHYKNGSSQNIDISELANYVTKSSEKQEEVAKTIKEAVVSYPIVICQNHIDIIDTPGLNDDEDMTLVTIGLLHDIDAAIVAVSALSPFSDTEKNFVVELIKSKQISNIIFVVTFIDQIDEDDFDRLFENTQKRIADLVMGEINQRYSTNEELVHKAHRILDHMNIFPVSAAMALKSFASNDRKLLAKSKFVEFKEGLYKILTAHQTVHVVEKAVNVIKESSVKLSETHHKKSGKIKAEISEKKAALKQINNYFLNGVNILDKMFAENNCKFDVFEKNIRKLSDELQREFEKKLSSIKENKHEFIRKAVSEASLNGYSIMAERSKGIRMSTLKIFGEVTKQYFQLRRETLLSNIKRLGLDQLDEFKGLRSFENELINQLNATRGAGFSWKSSTTPNVQNLENCDIIGYVRTVISLSLEDYIRQLQNENKVLRLCIFTAFDTEKKLLQTIINSQASKIIEKLEIDLLLYQKNFKIYQQSVERIVEQSSTLLKQFYS